MFKPTNHEYKKIAIGMIAFLFIFICAISWAIMGSVSTASASPLLDDPTPTPTQTIAYWAGSYATFTWTQGDGANVGLQNAGNAGWLSDADGDGDYYDITAPEDNSPAGILVRLNSVSYDGDSSLIEQTNTDWVKKFSDSGWGDPTMTPGQTICVGTTGGCSSQGYSVDANSDWEGYVDGDPLDYIEDVRIYTQLGSSGSLSITVQPIWYGVFDCEPVDPETREFISTGLLHGTDDEGETFDLVADQQYILMTGGGPWNDGTDDRYDVGVRFLSSETADPPSTWSDWTALESLQGGDDICDTSFVDANGAVFMFTADEETQTQIQFRVNDTDGEFSDNSGDVEYYWLGGEGSSQGCENRWTIGAQVASDTIDSSAIAYGEGVKYDLNSYFSGGGRYDGRIAGGETYLFKVIGKHNDGGIETFDGDLKVLAGVSDDGWDNPGNAFLNGDDYCEDETSNYAGWYGVTKSEWTPGLWNIPGSYPYVQFGTPGDNSGSVTAEWYESTWSAPETDCATKFDIGTFIESPIVFADRELGVTIPQQMNGFVTGQVYYLESKGPAYSKDGSASWDFMVRNNALESWSTPDAFFDCITQIDQNHYGYYWFAEYPNLDIRAQTGLFADYDDNTGTLKYVLHGAISEEVPDGESCSDYYSLDELVWRGDVDADETTGYSIDHSVFDPGEVYSVKITQSYTDPVGNGKTGEIRRSTTGGGSVDWEDMEDWGGAICHETVDDYDVVYFKATELSDYEVRATSPVGNSGTMGFEVWGTGTDGKKTHQTGCEWQYNDIENWFVVKQNDSIFANNRGAETDDNDHVVAITGYVMANEFSEQTLNYKIETNYMNPDNMDFGNRWDLQISDDGGQTWGYLEDWVDCWVDLGTPQARGYFTSPKDGGPYVLRVYDADGNYFNNEGGVRFNMWVDSETEDPGDVWEDPFDAKGWGVGCYAYCASPGLLQVGEWVEYARCRFSSWLAWCPWHAQEISDIREMFGQVEPFRTMMELVRLTGLIQDEVNSYTWTDDGGGSGENDGQVASPENFLFMPGEGGGGGLSTDYLTGPDTIWGEGEIDIYPDEISITYSSVCNTELSEVMGTRMGRSMCFGFNIIDQLGILTWFQLLWDLFMLIAFSMYFKINWVDKLQS